MKDYLVKSVAFNNQVRAYAVTATQTTEEARRRHQMFPGASIAMGRSLSACVMMGAMMKGESQITIRLNGGGPLGTILIDANTKGSVRGYVSNPQVEEEFQNLDIASLVGVNGEIVITKGDRSGQPYVGHVPLVSGEIGEDLCYYYTHSEQTPTSVGVGVLVNEDSSIQAAGGFILQLLPNTSDETIEEISERLEMLPSISKLISQGLTPEQLLEQVLGENQVTVMERLPVEFDCTCSHERIANALISLGVEELDEMIQEDGKAEAHCHFCNEYYHFNQTDLELLKESAQRKVNQIND